MANPADPGLVVIPHVGTEVVAERRFPRPSLEAEFDAQMLGTNGGRLFDLRRIGKSSEAAACCDRLRAANMIVIKEDAQGKTSEADLLLAILQHLPNTGIGGRLTKLFLAENALTQTLRDALSKYTGNARDIEAYFPTIAAVVERAIDRGEGMVLVIDEFPWLCQSILSSDSSAGRQRVDLLLAALRRWRVQGMRMLLIGSIGMTALGRRYKLDLSHLTDLQPLHVPTLDRIEAEQLCAALARGAKVADWTQAHTAALLDETVALYPVMIQKAFQMLTVGRTAAPLNRIGDLFAEKIRPDLDTSYYSQFDKRIKLYDELPEPLPGLVRGLLDAVFDVDLPVAREAFERVGQGTGATISDADIGDALQILREDGFLAMRADRDGAQTWRVASDLVRSWRRQRRGARRP